MSTNNNHYRHLAPKPGSKYRQLFIKDRNTRAVWVYRSTIREVDPYTPEQAAEDFDLPLEAVHEAIDYCRKNQDLLAEESAKELADIRRRGLDKPPYVPADFQPSSHDFVRVYIMDR